MKHPHVLALAIVLLAANAASAITITYDDGGNHTLSASSTDSYVVQDGPLAQSTTLEIAAGASISGGVSIQENSLFYMTGGLKNSQGIDLHHNSQGVISGGTINTGVSTFGNSTLTMNGGGVHLLEANDGSAIDIHNMTFISFNAASGIYILDNAVVTFFGSDFSSSDVADDLFPATWDKHILTGKFETGTPFQVAYYYLKSDPGTLSLVEVPEPSALVLAIVGVTGLAALLRSKRSQLANGSASTIAYLSRRFPIAARI